MYILLFLIFFIILYFLRIKFKAFCYRKTSSVKTIFIGDSLIECCDFSSYFKNKISNRGIWGATTVDILSFIKYLPQDVSNIFLLIGTNDLNNIFIKNKIISNYNKIFTILKNKYPNSNIYIESLYPVNRNKFNLMMGFRNNVKINSVNCELKKLVSSFGFIYLDVNKILVDENGNLNSNYTFDGLHLNKLGYDVVTDYIKKKTDI